MEKIDRHNDGHLSTITEINELFDTIAGFFYEDKLKKAKKTLLDLHYADLADFLDRYPKLNKQVIQLLGSEMEPETLMWLSNSGKLAISHLIPLPDLAKMVDQLDLDDAIEFIEILGADNVRQELLSYLTPEKQFHIIEGFTYPEHTAGRVMDKKFVSFQSFWTVGQAVDSIRRGHLNKEFYAAIVVDNRHRPLGTILLSALLQHPRSTPIRGLINEEFKVADTHTTLDTLSYVFKQYALTTIPVVNKSGRLVGTISIDHMLYIVEEQAEEDIMQMGGVFKQDVFSGIFSTVQHRFPWLFINLVTACVTSVIISQFSNTIAQLVALASLMPIVASMGGNAGTQVLTVTVRALANNDIGNNIGRALLKESMVCCANGILLGIIGGSATLVMFNNIDLSLVFGAAVIINFTAAGFFGAVVPICLNHLKIDPAAASGVFLTALTDSFGFFSFLTLAYFFLV